ncbi:hypothetical protein ACHAWF_016658 [Thalassiosira exigua]
MIVRRTASSAGTKGVGGFPPRDSAPPKRTKRSKGRPTNTAPWVQLANLVFRRCYDFFHARTGPEGCRTTGVMRACYACLYCYSLCMLTVEAKTLFDPKGGLVPHFLEVDEFDPRYVFAYFPESRLLVFFMFLIGQISGVCLLLGVKPRLAAAGCFFFLYNVHNHNSIVFDTEYNLSRIWLFFFMFLPLDHVTIYDGFGGLYPIVRRKMMTLRHKSNLPLHVSQGEPRSQKRLGQSTSWPMWPYRLWQVYVCLVYLGAGMGKYNSEEWQEGVALAWLWYDTPGRFYPRPIWEFLFNKIGPIKAQTWMSLAVENLCYVTIWPLTTRKITFYVIAMLHIGIELALEMHIFEYLSVLGWVSFLVYPDDGKPKLKNKVEDDNIEATKSLVLAPGRALRKIVETVFAASIMYALIYDAYPVGEAVAILPRPLAYLTWRFVNPPWYVADFLDDFLANSGLHYGTYTVFKGVPPHTQGRLTAVVRFNDGRDPVLYTDFNQTSWMPGRMPNEVYYWWDTYFYNIMMEDDGADFDPHWYFFSVYLAEKYGDGKVRRNYRDVEVDEDNVVESVSVQIHTRSGSGEWPPDDLGAFDPIPREWYYESYCRVVFAPKTFLIEGPGGEVQRRTFDAESLWDNDDEDSTGCSRYNDADEELHRRGRYAEPGAGDDDDKAGGDGKGEQGRESTGETAEGKTTNALEKENSNDGKKKVTEVGQRKMVTKTRGEKKKGAQPRKQRTVDVKTRN